MTGTTTVVNVRDSVPGAVYVGRPTPWGNPYRLAANTVGTRKRCVESYREWLRTQPELVERIRQSLRGKALACFCAPLPCHADVIAAVADGEEP